MSSDTWPVHGPWTQEHCDEGIEEGKRQRKEEALSKVRALARLAGWAQGRIEGWLQGWIEAVLVVLEARGVRVSAVDRERVTGCRDADQLEVWLRRSVAVESPQELFAGPEPARSA
ncbi:hypothetical protein Sme01_26830 [Sphaerisporangium melleum]|uniref:Uncharacterized protein n=2 Tax=Sphaerisporangium melleum TaxID=321316 RepID=A0A917QW66_9ACTN|nr:hypothetical protein GCM10007964_12510 [Sphaerisporangium melleum]GII70207.1 hypothetical protein Sme01_26830 [Sphaerisporangium melleum]